MNNKKKFKLPPSGSLEPNDEIDDPLKYYYHPIAGPLFRKRIQAGLDLLSPPYNNILEIGYGSGLLLPTLCGMGNKIYGIDLVSEPKIVLNAIKKFGAHAELFKEDIGKWEPPQDLFFDLVVAFSVFEHLHDPVRMVGPISRYVRSGGLFLVGMPRVDKFMTKCFSMIGYSRADDVHVTTYREFLKTTEKYFDIVKVKTFPSILPLGASLYYNILLKKK